MKNIIILYCMLISLNALAQTEVEPNEAFNTSTLITTDIVWEGKINIAGDRDCYRFDVTESGIVGFEFLQVPSNLNLEVFIYDENETEIYYERGNDGQSFNFEVTTCGIGSHYVFMRDRQINSADNPDFNTTEEYTFIVNFTNTDNTDTCECENESFAQACAIELGDTISAIIAPYFDDNPRTVDRDVYKFNISEPSVISFELLQVPSNINLFAIIYDENQEEIYSQSGSDGQNFSFEVSSCGVGDHFLFIGDRQNNSADIPDFNSQEQYVFQLGQTPFSSLDTCECENESFAQACAIELGDTISAIIAPYFDDNPRTVDRDVYKFNISEPGVISFELLQVPSNINIQAILYNEVQNEVYDFRGNIGQNFSFDVSTCSNGLYYLYIGDGIINSGDIPAFNALEQYNFNINHIPFDSIDVYECNETIFEASELDTCTTIEAAFLPNLYQNGQINFDRDFYTLNLTENMPMEITIENYSNKVRTRLKIFDSNGNEIVDEVSNTGFPLVFEFTPLETGSYFLEITDIGPESGQVIEPYNLSIDCGLINDITNLDLIRLITVFPNPFTEYIMIDLTSFTNQSYEIVIYNALGNTVFFEKDTASVNRQIDTEEFPAGAYFIKLRIGNERYVKKLLKN